MILVSLLLLLALIPALVQIAHGFGVHSTSGMSVAAAFVIVTAMLSRE